MRPTVMVVFDAVRDEISLDHARAAASRASRRRRPMRRRWRASTRSRRRWSGPCRSRTRIDPRAIDFEPPVSNTTPGEFVAMVSTRQGIHPRRRHLSGRAVAALRNRPSRCPPSRSTARCGAINPAPFLCYLDFEDFQIVCSSPEILVRVRDGKVTIRPIAGTRPRGATAAEDRAHAESLLADPKERAEHLMLLDLGRNDVGRVAKMGSRQVTDQFFLEYYSQVMHIVSNVEGALDDALRRPCRRWSRAFRPARSPALRRCAPWRSSTSWRSDKRGPYGGCIGYFGANGEMDTCIVLRTAVVKDGRMAVQAGAGIVLRFGPASEQQECINKAKALFGPARMRCASRAAPGSASEARARLTAPARISANVTPHDPRPRHRQLRQLHLEPGASDRAARHAGRCRAQRRR